MPLKTENMGKAYAAIRSDLGRRACSEGWIVALFEYIAANGVWPDRETQDQLRDNVDAIEAAKVDWPAFARDAHTRRAQRLERIANGLE